jgi:A/G-specific adenine glycosylase
VQLDPKAMARLDLAKGRIMEWYAMHGRELPWRGPSVSEYERICVEVLLQRTRAETVAGMYDEFFSRFPSWQAIAEAAEGDLEHHLKKIGLWRRRSIGLRALASEAVDLAGEFPSNQESLLELPAVGHYVANAILLFQHGQKRPLLDVNMARFLERFLGPRGLADIRHDPGLHEASLRFVNVDDPVRLNWAVLDFGSAVCRPRMPRCSECPVREICLTGTGGEPGEGSRGRAE